MSKKNCLDTNLEALLKVGEGLRIYHLTPILLIRKMKLKFLV